MKLPTNPNPNVVRMCKSVRNIGRYLIDNQGQKYCSVVVRKLFSNFD